MEQKRNLWVIPTEKPTYLYEMEGKLHLSDKFEKGNDFWHNQNIFITSDEEIKVGYHVFNTKNNHYGGVVNKNNLSDARLLSYIKKIILTTDQDLIKDGVQAIDNDFLEWFVAHPSCEFVEVEKFRSFKEIHSPYEYMIIIPKEETKFEDSIENSVNIMSIANSMFGKKEEPKPVWKQIIEDCGGKEAFMEAAGLKPKQETLEEFAKQEAIKQYSEDTFGNLIVRKSIEKGAKWQQEQDKKLYSEEDLINAFNEGQALNVRGKLIQGKEWFEQFKKK
jgi:hypothetical protein